MRVGATLCLVVFLAAVTPAAQGTTSANLVPNPGFELLSASCGGAPVCNWTPTSNVTLARDTSIKKSGTASLSFTLTGMPTFNVADSDCVNTPVAAGPHTGTGSGRRAIRTPV